MWGWIITIILIIAVFVTAILLIRRYFRKKPNVSPEDEEWLELMTGNDDIVIDLTRPRGHMIYETSRKYEGQGLGGKTKIRGFPRDLIRGENGEFIQDPYKGETILVGRNRLITLVDNTRSPRTIHFTLPNRTEDLPEGKVGEMFRPYMVLRKSVESVIEALIKQNKKQEELIEMVGSGEIEEMAVKKAMATKNLFNVEEMAKKEIIEETQ